MLDIKHNNIQSETSVRCDNLLLKNLISIIATHMFIVKINLECIYSNKCKKKKKLLPKNLTVQKIEIDGLAFFFCNL